MNELSPTQKRLLKKLIQEKGLAMPRQPVSNRAAGEGSTAGAGALSLEQEALWFMDQLHPGKPFYNIPGTLRLLGNLQPGALAAAFGEIVRRHEVLRSTFHADEEGRPYQRPGPALPFELPILDLSALPADQKHAECRQLAEADARTGFDLGRGPLFRARLIRLDDDDHVLLLNFHHIVADGWSMGILSRELSALYAAYSQGKSARLPDLHWQYADYARWQRDQLWSQELDARLKYWRENLDGAPRLKLPADRDRPTLRTYLGKHQPIQVDRQRRDAIARLGRSSQASLFMVLLSAFYLLLHSYSGQLDLVVGTGFANRERAEVESLIGYFVRVLPLRAVLDPEMSLLAFLERVREVVLETTSQQLPLSVLVRELQPERDAGSNPYFQVEFTLLTPDVNPAIYGYGGSQVEERLELDGVRGLPFEVEGGLSRFDLAVFLWDTPSGLQGSAEYSLDLFTEATITGMIERFRHILDLVPDRADQQLATLLEQVAEAGIQPSSGGRQDYLRAAKGKLSQVKRKPLAG